MLFCNLTATLLAPTTYQHASHSDARTVHHGTSDNSLNNHAQMFYKSARVEYHPLGVVGAIVPWNYPFHNVFNPLTAALFAGNALVIKVNHSFDSQQDVLSIMHPRAFVTCLPQYL